MHEGNRKKGDRPRPGTPCTTRKKVIEQRDSKYEGERWSGG